MSTKVSVAYGDNFHFYQECLDEENVHLQIEGVEFKANRWSDSPLRPATSDCRRQSK